MNDRRPNWFQRSLAFFGVVHDPEHRWIYHVRPRFFKILGGVAAAALVALVGLVNYSTSPTFCHSCHIMEPYYQAWKASKHNKAACVDCHYPPSNTQTYMWRKFQSLSQVAKFFTKTYSSKPYAEVQDSACLREGCHSKKLLEGSLVTTSLGAGFDHRIHLNEPLKGLQMTCTSCHTQKKVSTHIEVNWETCFLCHFKGRGTGKNLKPIGGCKSCHTVPTKTFEMAGMKFNHATILSQHGVECNQCHSEVVQGSGDSPQERCLSCHNQQEKLTKFADVPSLHRTHVTQHTVGCFQCHGTIRHSSGKTQAAANEGGVNRPMNTECGQCHQGQHIIQKDFYAGNGAVGLDRYPSPMYQSNVDCVACHTVESTNKGKKEYAETTYRARKEPCERCHGSHYRAMWEEAKVLFGSTLGSLQAKLQQAKIALAASPHGDQTRATLRDVEHNLELVRSSKPVHNLYYAARILESADQTLNALGEKADIKLTQLDDNAVVSGKFCGTLCHQKIGVKVPPEEVQFQGKVMPHAQHLELGFSCFHCHDLGQHKHIKVRANIKEEVCDSCHG